MVKIFLPHILTGSEVPLRSLAARFLAYEASRLSTVPLSLRLQSHGHTRIMTTLRASPETGLPVRPEPSFFGRIGLSLLEFAPMEGDGEEESSRFGRIRIAKAKLVQAWVGRDLHTLKPLVDQSICREKRAPKQALWELVGGGRCWRWRRQLEAHCAAEAPESCTQLGAL
jgi:hypothetical protein